jgi:hypothetical protein
MVYILSNHSSHSSAHRQHPTILPATSQSIGRHPPEEFIQITHPIISQYGMQLSTKALSLALLPLLITATTDGKYQGWHDGSYHFSRDDGASVSGWPAMNEWLDFNTL